ncbi:hypothetical protein KKG41_04610 [Patescibacteria group bacterium]|nr:hypothetical protein [Patescibacteria group bacterium]MBU1890845.1 hypothetical protein [Patescibacteria group bacterium]
MKKSLFILMLSLVCLGGLVYWWQTDTQQADREVKGRVTKPSDEAHIVSDWERPFITDRNDSWKIMSYETTAEQVNELIPGEDKQLLPVLIDNDELIYFTATEGFYKLWRYSLLEKSNIFVIGIRQAPIELEVAANGRFAVYTVLDTSRSNLGNRCFLVNLETRQIKEIGSGIRDIEISPDNRHIAYTMDHGLYFIEVLHSKDPTSPIMIQEGDIEAPVFSKSGERIYFIKQLDDVASIVSTDLRGAEDKEILALEVSGGNAEWTMELSQDGEKLLYTDIIDSEALRGNIGWIRTDGTDQHYYVNQGISAHWSKTGHEIWYNRLEIKNGQVSRQIWKMNDQGNYREAVTQEGNNWF